jgi:hypothetical protein
MEYLMFDLGISGQDVASHKMTTHAIQKGKFAGQTLELWQQDFGDFGSMCREALEYWKSGYIRTYAENAKFMPENQQLAIVREAFDKAAEMTYDQLPSKVVKIPVPDGNGGFLKDARGEAVARTESVDYVRWWMATTPEGQAQFILLSMRKSPAQSSISLDTVNLMFRESMEDMLVCVEKIGQLSEPQILKNAESSPSSSGNGRATIQPIGNVIDKATRRRLKKQRQAERRVATLAGVTS